jgi:transposase-like protein
MAKLSDVRRRFPPEDSEAYVRAYAEAELAGALGALVHGLRVSRGFSVAELARRMGIDKEEVLRAEEGDASLTVAFLDGVARAAGARVRMAASDGGVEVVLGASGPPRPSLPPPPQSAV